MNGARIVAEKYAKAFYAAARAAGTEGSVLTDLELISGALSDKKTARFFNDPSVSLSLKEQTVFALDSAGVSRQGVWFLALLLREGRLNVLKEVRERVKLLAAQAAGEVHVEAEFAKQPDQAAKERLNALLQRALGLKPQVRYTVNSDLLGGFKVRAGAKQYDFTLQTRLRRLADHCKTEAA